MKAIYLIPLLLWPTCSAAVITPLGGSWTDGTTVVEYTELPQTQPNVREWQALLFASNGTNVLAEASMLIQGNLTFGLTVDAYDGGAEISGQFDFRLPHPGGVNFLRQSPSGLDIFVNGSPAGEFAGFYDLPAGQHTLSWELAEPSIGLTHRSLVAISDVPEPGAVGFVWASLALVIWWRVG